MSLNGTLVEDKMRSECAHFSFNKCLIYTHDSASDKFNTNSRETDKSVYVNIIYIYYIYIISFSLLLNTPNILFVGCIYHTILDRVG